MGLCKSSGLIKKMDWQKPQKHKMEGVFQTKEQKQTARACVYCEKQGHKASQCESVKSVEDRRLIISKKKLCFNCTEAKQSHWLP